MATFIISLFGREQHMARIGTMVSQLGPRILNTMKNEMVRLADYVRSQKLSGEVLNRRSGDLSRSITGQASQSGSTVTGTTGTKGIPYAAIHEFGAVFQREVTQAFGRPIIPVSATFHYPERSFLRTSAEENADRISASLRSAASEVFRAT